VLDVIGFPDNRVALPYVVSMAADINSINWELAVDILQRLGTDAVPEIRVALRAYSQDYEEYNLYIQGLCQVLEGMPPDVSKQAMPELLTLFEEGTDGNYGDEFALWPLKKIGSPNGDSVIPMLAGKISAKNRSVRIRKKCIEALRHFDQEKIKPCVHQLRNAIQDSGELVTDIQDLLNWIDRSESN
jgi:hypothetical protein